MIVIVCYETNSYRSVTFTGIGLTQETALVSLCEKLQQEGVGSLDLSALVYESREIK